MTQEVKTKATFPSVEWFNAIRQIVNDDPGYKHIGTCDATVGIKIPDLQKYYLLTFEAFEVSDVREATETEAWRKRQGYRRTADNLHIYVDLLDRLASSEVQDVR